jgi:hypothetical protein
MGGAPGGVGAGGPGGFEWGGDEGLLYDLTAVVQHLGASSSSGHYVVYRRLTPPGAAAAAGGGGCRTAGDGGAGAATDVDGRAIGSDSSSIPSKGIGRELAVGRFPNNLGSLQHRASAEAQPPLERHPGRILDGAGSWVRISDTSVVRVGLQQVLACDATLVLYERRPREAQYPAASASCSQERVPNPTAVHFQSPHG